MAAPSSTPPVTPYGAPLTAPDGVGARGRAAALRAIRHYGCATADLRRLPDHLIIGTDQVLVLRSEDLYDSPLATCHQVLDFLGLERHDPAALTAWNRRDRSPLDGPARARLTELLAPDVAALETLLDRPMGWT